MGPIPNCFRASGGINSPCDARRFAREALAQLSFVQRGFKRLTSLGLDNAIRMRWPLRDIRGKRLKLSPVDPNDLCVLIDMGYIEMINDEPGAGLQSWPSTMRSALWMAVSSLSHANVFGGLRMWPCSRPSVRRWQPSPIG